MNRTDFQKLTTLRLREAKLLLENKYYEGAFYLAGYAVECALKACVAKKTKRYEFPPKNADKLYTHDLEALVKGADLGVALKAKESSDIQFKLNWAVVKDWKEQARYETEIDNKRTGDLYFAITDKKHEVLSWLKKYW